MTVDCVLLKSDLLLDDLAEKLRGHLSLPGENASSQTQRRHGQNRGGDYYLFETLGLELLLMKNAGESQLCDNPTWSYHVTLDFTPYDRDLVDMLLRHVARVLATRGMDVQAMEDAF